MSRTKINHFQRWFVISWLCAMVQVNADIQLKNKINSLFGNTFECGGHPQKYMAIKSLSLSDRSKTQTQKSIRPLNSRVLFWAKLQSLSKVRLLFVTQFLSWDLVWIRRNLKLWWQYFVFFSSSSFCLIFVFRWWEWRVYLITFRFYFLELSHREGFFNK